MSDRDNDKIVSLDQRRRQDAARQKAEIAAAAKRRPQAPGRGIKSSFGQPMPGRAANSDGGGFGAALGTVVAWLVWGGLVVMGGLALWAGVRG